MSELPEIDGSRISIGRPGGDPAAPGSEAEEATGIDVHDAHAVGADDELDRSLRPAEAGRLRQPGPGHRPAGDLHRGGKAPRRAARPRPARRPAWPRQDVACLHRRRRARRPARADRRTGAGAKGRRRCLPHRAGAEQRLLHRRDPPARPRGRGDPLSRDGGLPASRRPRPGRRCPHRHPAAAPLHPDRGDDPQRPADHAAARPLRGRPPARALLARGPGTDRRAVGGDPGDRGRALRRGGDRRALARHAAGWPTGC